MYPVTYPHIVQLMSRVILRVPATPLSSAFLAACGFSWCVYLLCVWLEALSSGLSCEKQAGERPEEGGDEGAVGGKGEERTRGKGGKESGVEKGFCVCVCVRAVGDRKAK